MSHAPRGVHITIAKSRTQCCSNADRRAQRGLAAIAMNSLEALEAEGNAMTTYVTLYKYTEQGIRNIKEAPARVEAAKKAAAQAGMTIKEVLWLQGEYDFLAIAEATDEIAAAAFTLNIAKMGNVHGQTMRAFTLAEMEKILTKVA